jgi:hypothetical protein
MPRRFPGHHHGIPTDMFTSDDPGVRRLQVDVGQTGFFAGREFRVFHEYVVAGTPLVFRVTVPDPPLKGIFLHDLRLTCHQGGVHLRTYRGGTAGGTWTAKAVWPNNGIPDIPGYVNSTAVEFGGTRSGGIGPTDAVSVFCNETGKSSTTSAVLLSGERGLPAGVYFIELTAIAGVSVDSLGEVSAVFEERLPDDSWV